jgi:hypothetical protein
LSRWRLFGQVLLKSSTLISGFCYNEDMAIYLITGKPGSGKTYYLAKKGKEFLEQGYNVYSNFPLKTSLPNYHFYTNFQDLIEVQHGIILMDEAQIYLNSRFWDKLPASFQYKLQQHRKHGLDIWGAVQHSNRLDVIFRELVNYYYEIKKIGSNEKKAGGYGKFPWGLFFLVEYDIKDANKLRRHLNSLSIYFLRKKIYEFYDTNFDLGFKAEKGSSYTADVFICPHCKARRVNWSTLKPKE